MTDPIINQNKINELQQLLNNNNRTQAYLNIFEITGSTSVLREAYISSFSEGYGSIANTANDIAQWAHADTYTLAVDDFSRAIAARLVSDMQHKLDTTGNGYLTDLEINASAQAEWDSRNLGEAFPGSPILAVQYLGNSQFSQFVDSGWSIGTIYSGISVLWNYTVSPGQPPF